MSVQIEEQRKNILHEEFEKPYFQTLKDFLVEQKKLWKTVFPNGKDIFRAFTLTPWDQVRVVILWQDPYHGIGQAMGLSFSVPQWILLPPSLNNIFKELKSDLGIENTTGDLTAWAQQWVLLLNAFLTVEKDQPASHQKIGWEFFTDAVIKKLSEEKSELVFMLRGKFAQSKEVLIDQSKHLVLKAAHPSPFSAHSGFFGSQPFSRINTWLADHGKTPINWKL